MSTDSRPMADKQLIALPLEEFTLRNNHDDNITYFAKCSYIPAAVAAYSRLHLYGGREGEDEDEK